jgi:BirA family biotin operon repressor/biotin-[acetyl-CoA-carboxylase] ligase
LNVGLQFGLAEFTEIDSTNEEALRRARGGERGPLWLRADRQSAGRGRRGRAWTGGEGNLFATLLLTPERARNEWAQLSFAAAIATADTAAEFAPHANIAVKWPNDVLAEGRKLAGILLETTGQGGSMISLAIGIGVNLAGHPEGTEFPAISLPLLGVKPPVPQVALDVLAGHFGHWYGVWMEQGFEPLREAWLARAAHLGHPIRARLPDKEHLGVFEGIDGEGALLLNQGQSVKTIAAGEVFFG